MNFDKKEFDSVLVHTDQPKKVKPTKEQDNTFLWVAVIGILVIGLIMYLNMKNNEQ